MTSDKVSSNALLMAWNHETVFVTSPEDKTAISLKETNRQDLHTGDIVAYRGQTTAVAKED